MTKAVNFTIQKPVHVFFFSFLCFYIMKILCLEYSVTFFDTIGYDYQKNNDLRWYHCGAPLWYQHHTLAEPCLIITLSRQNSENKHPVSSHSRTKRTNSYLTVKNTFPRSGILQQLLQTLLSKISQKLSTVPTTSESTTSKSMSTVSNRKLERQTGRDFQQLSRKI